MEGNVGGKLTGIWQVVRLKEILQKWQSATLSTKTTSRLPSQSRTRLTVESGKKIAEPLLICESDEEGCMSPEPPHDVPKGYLAVYVGQELRRFIIPTSYLNDPLFKVLLEKVEEEFGFDHSGALTIPCDIETFKYLLKCMETHQKVLSLDTTDGKSL